MIRPAGNIKKGSVFMNFLNNLKRALRQFMEGRHGADQLGMFTLLSGLVFSLVGSVTRITLISFPGFLFYVITLFRMFSRNHTARLAENQKYLSLTSGWKLKSSQFVKRLKNRKDYKYFRCPGCKVLLRLKRGCGEKEITCVRCGHKFRQKA